MGTPELTGARRRLAAKDTRKTGALPSRIERKPPPPNYFAMRSGSTQGDDPDGFAAEIKERFGLDVTKGGERTNGYAWTDGYAFFVPPEHIDTIDGSGRWPLGS